MQRKYVHLRAVLAALLVFSFAIPAHAAEWVVGPGSGADFQSIQEAVDSPSVTDGDVIKVRPNPVDAPWEGAVINKAITIEGAVSKRGKLLTTIGRGLKKQGKWVGFAFPGTETGDSLDGSNATIKNFNFDAAVQFPVYSLGADNVTVDNNTMTNPVQGITNWNGSGWNISHNTITGLHPAQPANVTRAKGGVGIMVGTLDNESKGVSGRPATGNKIRFNTITGNVTVGPATNDGISMAGIGLVDNSTKMNDTVTENTIVSNYIDLKIQKVNLGKSRVLPKLYGIMLNEVGVLTTDGTITNNIIFKNVIGGVIENALAEKPLLEGNIYGKRKSANVTVDGKAIPAPTEAKPRSLSVF